MSGDRELPHSLDAETYVLGACVLDNRAIPLARAIVGPADFFRREHGALFALILEMAAAGQPVDGVSLSEAADRRRRSGRDSGLDPLLVDEITKSDAVPHAINIEHHAGTVAAHAHRRRAMLELEALIGSLYRDDRLTDEIIGEAFAKLTAGGRGKPSPLSQLSDAALGLFSAVDIEARPIEWFWPNRIERGELTLLSGPGGQGKTMLGLYLAALCTIGGTLPDGAVAPKGRVVVVSDEDSWESSLKPRLAALGADMSLISFVRPQAVTTAPDGTERVDPQSFQDLAYWQEVLGRLPDTVMMLVDPLPSYLGQGVDDHRNSDVRAVLERFIATVIRPRGIALVATTHSNKKSEDGQTVNRVIGSVAYVNLARNVHLVIGDPDDSGRSFARQDKANHAPRDVDALEFRIESLIVEVDGRQIPTVAIRSARAVNRSSVAYAFDGQKKKGRKKGGEVTDRMIRWLYRALDDAFPDAVQVKDLVHKAQDDGLLEVPSAENPKPSISILYKAMEELGRLYDGKHVDSTKDGAKTFWRLSNSGPDGADAPGRGGPDDRDLGF